MGVLTLQGRGQCLGVSQLLPEAPQSLPQPGVREPSPQAPPVGGTQGPGDSLVLGWAVPSGRRAQSSPQSVSVSPTLSRRRGVWGRYRSGPAGLRTPAGGWAGGLWKGPRFSAQGPETSPRPPGWGSDLCPQRPHPGLPASSPLCPVVCPAALEAVHTGGPGLLLGGQGQGRQRPPSAGGLRGRASGHQAWIQRPDRGRERGRGGGRAPGGDPGRRGAEGRGGRGSGQVGRGGEGPGAHPCLCPKPEGSQRLLTSREDTCPRGSHGPAPARGGASRACFQSWWAAPTPRTAGSTLPRSEAQPGLSLRPPGPGAGPSLRVPSPPPPQGLTPSLRGQGGVRVCLEECMKWGEGRDTHGSLGCAPSSSAISGDFLTLGTSPSPEPARG